MSISPTNGELAIMLTGLDKKMDTAHESTKTKLISIEAHVVATNGRVTSLEKAKWLTYGFVAALSAFLLPVVVSWLKTIFLN